MTDVTQDQGRRHSLMLCAIAILLTWSQLASAQDWMYRRSYFSHVPADGGPVSHPLPESRSAYRTAYYREGFGFSVRSAYRINNFVLQSGNRIDRTYYREGYFEFQPN